MRRINLEKKELIYEVRKKRVVRRSQGKKRSAHPEGILIFCDQITHLLEVKGHILSEKNLHYFLRIVCFLRSLYWFQLGTYIYKSNVS